MKRAVASVKRKKADTGAKRKAPRRRSAAKITRASNKTPRRAVQRKKVAQAKAIPPRRVIGKRKTAAPKPRRNALTSRRKRDQPARLAIVATGKKSALAAKAPAANRVAKAPGTGKLRSPRRKPASKAKSIGTRTAIAKRKPLARQPRLKVPPILLEGDEPELPALSGPGKKFALGPETPAAHFTAAATHLPATYGTGRLFLTARDPHWLYAHWDINTTVQFQHNARSVHRHLILRMHEGNLQGRTAAEIHVHPESRHWFAHVEGAGAQYVADLGYYQAGHKWKSLATSAPMRTPPETVSTDATVEFATIPLEVPFEMMLALLKEENEPELPLAHAVEQLRARRRREFPAPERTITTWTPEKERALTEIVATGQSQRPLRGSQEVSGQLAEQLRAGEGLSAGPGSLDLSSFFGGEQVSSPLGGGESVAPEFWFNVNAELIIYGATEPDAKVTIGGKPVALQADGSFRCHFALPDGQYELPIVAVAADDADGRAVDLKFARASEVLGAVGSHPQDPELKPPAPKNV